MLLITNINLNNRFYLALASVTTRLILLFRVALIAHVAILAWFKYYLSCVILTHRARVALNVNLFNPLPFLRGSPWKPVFVVLLPQKSPSHSSHAIAEAPKEALAEVEGPLEHEVCDDRAKEDARVATELVVF